MTANEVSAPRRAEVRRLAAAELAAIVDVAWMITDRHDDANRQFLQFRARWHRSVGSH